MSLDDIRQTRQKWLEHKDIAPMRQALKSLPDMACSVSIKDTITMTPIEDISDEIVQNIYDTAWLMRPWRKGPFGVGPLFIDSEWQSFMKYNLIQDHIDITNKTVADIGCNNGYYMFRMLDKKPKKVVGFDPSALNKTQFDFINHFVKSDIVFEMLGVEHFDSYEHTFDVALCLGVIYHRSDPVGMLKTIRKGLNSGGELILDTFMIDQDADIALTPKERYAKIPNIYFVPTIRALKNWVERAGFIDFEVIGQTTTTLEEQRHTKWIKGQSLESFLNPHDATKTVEGYDAPKRVYIKAKRK